ncbi:chitotriosidase-1 isoform X1 [Brachionus plicatilis]|uniref:Chitotriosidase-1 isoform X1 n=1 Tax=Brachionus plicatilis TaxID=10195 RepID=A0A3M7PY15_BRAPC|nr:chitotriosidase-1 isoform X1 [Brachionus plicatilis]
MWGLIVAGNVRGGYLLWRSPKQDSFKLVCYMTNWAQYRPNNTKFVPSDLDPFLCTHYIYAFASINTTTYEIKSFEWNDESHDKFVGRYEEFNNMKKINPTLKTLLAVGGWNMGSGPFSDMATNETYRNTFIKSVVKFLRKWKFDGLDLDWEFPAKREGSKETDNRSFSYLVKSINICLEKIKELREAFYNEALAARKEQLLLSAAVAAEKFTILKAYEIENIVSYLDFISIMSYDYHGAWDKKLGHNSPLYSSSQDSEDDQKLSVDWTVRLYQTLGVPLEKLVLGIPFYGRSFTVQQKSERSFGSASVGEGVPGNATREFGFLSYGLEICKYLKEDNWTRAWSGEHQVPYAYKKNQWVGYDDSESVKIKVNYVTRHCLAGAMIWSIDLDDFSGFCSEDSFPLTRSILENLKNLDRKKCLPLPKVTDSDVDDYLKKSKKWNFFTLEPIIANIEHSTSTTIISLSKKPMRKLNRTRSTTKKLETTTFQTVSESEKQIEEISDSEQLNEIMMRIHESSDLDKIELEKILKQYLNNKNMPDRKFLLNSMKMLLDNRGKNLDTTTLAMTTNKKLFFQINSLNIHNRGCENLEDGELIRDVKDCASFFTCFMGKASKRNTCNKGLYFDDRLKVCNWKSEVDC